jgi:hypothetical protein
MESVVRAKKRVIELRAEIEEHDRRYYIEASPIRITIVFIGNSKIWKLNTPSWSIAIRLPNG